MTNDSFKGSNISLVKLHNLQVVLLSLLQHPNINRVLLAKKTNLSNSTISNIINYLIHQGVVTEELPVDPDPGETNPVGRPRTTLHLVPDARFVLGIHIGVGVFRIAMVNLRGEVCSSQIVNFRMDEPAFLVLDKIIATSREVLADCSQESRRILGAGVGASGLVDFYNGVNILAPNLNWHEVPVQQYLQNGLQLPVVVDNNVRCMALGEKYFGAAREVDSLVFVYGRIGVGAGLIFKGEAFRGSTTGAGEIGHTVMSFEGGEPCRCGNRGCLETLVSEPAILRQAQKIINQNPHGILACLDRDLPQETPIERVFAAARQSDSAVQALLVERAHVLGLAVAGLVNVFNPQMILFGGIFAQGQDLFLPTVIQTVQQTAFGGLGKRVQMQATTFGWKAGVIGAAALGLMYFFYQQADSNNWRGEN